MGAKEYRAITAWFVARPTARRLLDVAAKLLVAGVYLLYAGLLFWLLWQRDSRVVSVLAAPAFTFLSGTLLRTAIDRPRPYETLDFIPLKTKKTTGKSMPSRHCFCAAAIAVAAWTVCPALGVLGAVLAVGVALSRVLQGVHYPGDVLAGLAFGTVVCGTGMALIAFWAA